MSEAAIEQVVAHARESMPRECCGLLIGSGDVIIHAAPARNLSEHPHRYLLDPADHVKVLREARAAGLDVLGFYHSHPHSEAWPSPTDLAEASYPECVYLILGVRDGRSDVRLFRLHEGKAEQVELTTPSP